MVAVTLFSVFAFADSPEITKLADFKKVQVQFTKATVLKLSQFVRDLGRKNTENKNPNYRLLHESDKLTAESSGSKISCTAYLKTMLSNRVKSYAEDSVKFEKMINDKEAIVLSPESNWTITKISPNDLGVFIWMQSEKKTLQIDCEKRNSDSKEIEMLPADVLKVLSANEVKLVKDGKEIQSSELKTDEQKTEAPAPVDSVVEPQSP